MSLGEASEQGAEITRNPWEIAFLRGSWSLPWGGQSVTGDAVASAPSRAVGAGPAPRQGG